MNSTPFRMSPPVRPARSAFTLTELLTVIAIVGVLAAIIIPVVAKVRASARSTQCISNLRQIGIATNLYANDNKDRLPGPTTMGQGPCYYLSSTSMSRNLAALLRDYLAPPGSVPERGVNQWMQDVFSCPGWAAAGGYETPNHTSPLLTSYVLNLTPWPAGVWDGSNDIRPFGDTNSSSNPVRGNPRTRLSIARFPLGRTWMLVDADNRFLAEVMNYGTSTNYLDTPAHGSSRNVLFYDGHVAKVPHGEFQRYPE